MSKLVSSAIKLGKQTVLSCLENMKKSLVIDAVSLAPSSLEPRSTPQPSVGDNKAQDEKAKEEKSLQNLPATQAEPKTIATSRFALLPLPHQKSYVEKIENLSRRRSFFSNSF